MSRRIITGSVVLAAACTVGGLAILASSFDLVLPDSWGFRGFPAIFAVIFTWAGATMRPAHVSLWLRR